METNKKNGNSEASKLANSICAYRKDLVDKRNASKGSLDGYKSKIDQFEVSRGYQLCFQRLSEETIQFYKEIDNYELIDFVKSVEIIQTNVEDYIKKNSEVKNIIKDSSKLVNDLKSKLHDANNASCTMFNCLKSIIGFSDGSIPKDESNTDKKSDSFLNELKTILEITKSVSENGQEAAKAIVKIAGIHTFTTVEDLKPMAKSISEKTKQFKKVTDEYLKKESENAKEIQVKLGKVIDELNIQEFKFFEEKSIHKGIISTIDFICNRDCKPISEIEIICKKVSTIGKEKIEEGKESKEEEKEDPKYNFKLDDEL